MRAIPKSTAIPGVKIVTASRQAETALPGDVTRSVLHTADLPLLMRH